MIPRGIGNRATRLLIALIAVARGRRAKCMLCNVNVTWYPGYTHTRIFIAHSAYVCADRIIVIDVAPLRRLKHHASSGSRQSCVSWHLKFSEEWSRESRGRRVFIAGRLIDRLDCVANSFGNESTDKMDVTSLYYLVYSFPTPTNLHFRKLRPISRSSSRNGARRHGKTRFCPPRDRVT